MLKRHGTRLEIGTAEDVAELNAAEALLRASFKPVTTGFTNIGSSSNMASSSAVAVDLGGSTGGGFGASVSTRPGGAGSASGYSLPGAMARSQHAGESGGNGDGQPPSSATATPTSAYGGGAAPHVRLGHPTSVTAAAAAAAPTPASSSSAMSVHAQRALYRSGAGGSDVGSPPSRGSVGTDYAASSGPTPGGSGVGPGGRRATAQPLFFSPHSSGGLEEEDEDDVVVEVRGRPSMMRAPFAVPVPAASTRGPAPSMGGGGGEPRVPAGMQVPSAYARRGGPPAMPLPMPSRHHVLVDDGEGDEDEEEAPARPSRVSGRYQLPRSPGHGDPAGL